MKNNIQLMLKGLIIGSACIIPGVSGGTMALTLGIYEQLIQIASNISKDFKNNIKFLLPLGIGLIVAILALSTIISMALEKYEIQTVLLFIGLLLGGIPSLFSKTEKKTICLKNILISIVSFAIVLCIMLIKGKSADVNLININVLGYIILFLVGMLASATMVIPGISGSLVLMLIGYYKPIVNTIKDITHFNNILSNMLILIPFGIGVIVGIVVISKIINYLLNKYPEKTYYSIYGIIIASIVCIILPLKGFNITNTIVGIILGLVGFIGTYMLGKVEK